MANPFTSFFNNSSFFRHKFFLSKSSRTNVIVCFFMWVYNSFHELSLDFFKFWNENNHYFQMEFDCLHSCIHFISDHSIKLGYFPSFFALEPTRTFRMPDSCDRIYDTWLIFDRVFEFVLAFAHDLDLYSNGKKIEHFWLIFLLFLMKRRITTSS